MPDHRVFRYAAVGVANTVAGLLVIFAAKGLAGLPDVPANVLGYAVGIALGFRLNRTWTFAHRGDPVTALARYLGVLAVAYAANLLTVLFAIGLLGWNAYLAHVAGVVPYVLVGYAGSRHVAFRAIR